MPDSGFRFRLERVRALRERREEIAKQELAHAMDRLSESKQRLREVEARLKQAHAGQRDAERDRTITSADLIARQAFVERVEQQRRHGGNEVTRSQGEVADRGTALRAAAKEHQMLERLKERHRDAHVRELARREGQLLDEIAIDRFRRSVA
jgi:flagellar protein FliJ